MSEIVKSEYNALDEQGNYKTHYFKTSADQVVGLGRMKNTEYQVDDVVYSDTNNKVALKCTTAGTTSNTELDISTKNIGDTVTDGSVVWQVCNRTSDVTSVNGKTGDVVVDLPVGHMYWSVEPNVPAGRLPALGATYNRSLYADLWAWANSVGLVKSESEWQAIASANDGNCAYYSSGDGSSTFRVPKLPNTIASDVPSEVPVVGNGMTLGLTTGSQNCGIIGDYGNYGSCAFPNVYGTSVGASPTGAVTSPNKSLGITTDPTKSGIVAQTSATKITGQWLIVAFGTVSNVGNADVENVMQAIEQVQTGLGTLEQGVGTAIDYIIESYLNGANWYRIWKSGWVEQGGTNTVDGTVTITFLKQFATTNYTFTALVHKKNTDYSYFSFRQASKTKTSIKFEDSAGQGIMLGGWYACGQGA